VSRLGTVPPPWEGGNRKAHFPPHQLCWHEQEKSQRNKDYPVNKLSQRKIMVISTNEATLLEEICEDLLPEEDNVAASSIEISVFKNILRQRIDDLPIIK